MILMNKVFDILSQLNIEYKRDEPMKKHTSCKVGGVAKVFVIPNTQKKAMELVRQLLKLNIKYYIVGNGTNLLVSNNGFDGVIICTNKLKKIRVKNTSVYIESGVNLFALGKFLKEKELGGLEFLYGVPGSVGGAVIMNAGAYGNEIGNFVEYIKIFDGCKTKIISNKKMKFSYRRSYLQDKSILVLGVKLNLKKSNSKEIEKKQMEVFNKRIASQPYDKPSFGSTFKRQNNFAIGQIIDNLGLKGFAIGGAQISKKHAGFVINVGNATCQDYQKMIKYIQQKIFENYGFVPEPEVKFLE